MSLNNKIKQQGFTIVELLIVIVVIGILAAITIVAYNGIQNRGKAAAAQSLANAVVKKAEAYNTIASAYPANVAAFSGQKESTLDDTSVVNDGTALPTNEKQVTYKKCATGAAVYWYDATSSAANKSVAIGIGGFPSATNVAALCS
jgi:prepilin-type N-terminal cleavage/methylation domain-containing protein